VPFSHCTQTQSHPTCPGPSWLVDHSCRTSSILGPGALFAERYLAARFEARKGIIVRRSRSIGGLLADAILSMDGGCLAGRRWRRNAPKLVAARSSNSFSRLAQASSSRSRPAVVHRRTGFAESAAPHFLFEAKLLSGDVGNGEVRELQIVNNEPGSARIACRDGRIPSRKMSVHSRNDGPRNRKVAGEIPPLGLNSRCA